MSNIQDTSNTAPGLSEGIRGEQHNINAAPGVAGAAPGVGKAESAAERTGNSQASAGVGDEYPPQHHAGAVGLGPNYHTGPTFNDKMHGLKEKIVGKVTHDEAAVQRGQERSTGELYEKRFEEQEASQNPFDNPVKGETGLSGERNQLQPDDSKGIASKRLGEDSTTLGQ